MPWCIEHGYDHCNGFVRRHRLLWLCALRRWSSRQYYIKLARRCYVRIATKYLSYFAEQAYWIFLLFSTDRYAQVAQISIGVAILFTFGLQFYVPMDIIWRRLGPSIPKDKHNISQILLRAGIILIMGGVAAAVPKLEPFIGLVGSVFFSILGMRLDVRKIIRSKSSKKYFMF